MTESITVITGARLHFGLLVAGPPDCRRYGGIGLMINQPRFSLTARRAEQTAIHAIPATQQRILELLRGLGLGADDAGVEINVHEEIPAHAGLGSGTQLALAVGTAWCRLQANSVSVEELARRLGRGTRSVVGALGFESGGLIGQSVADEAGTSRPAPVRCDFPETWRFVLVTPPGDMGLSGDAERNAFCCLPPMTDRQLQRLDELQAELMSAARWQDFRSFGERLQVYGQEVGAYFAPLQSGTFGSRCMAELAGWLKRHDIQGVGQTSWGPTLFALCETERDAGRLAEQVRCWDRTSGCHVQIVAAKNSGATISSP